MTEKKKWFQSTGNWIFIIVCFVLGLVLLLNLSIIFQSKTDEDKVPSVFGIKPFMVLSGSMESKIHKGDLIFTKIVEPETLTKEDVIAFRDAEGTVTTHRIIDIVTENDVTYFITKGDNNSTQDQNLVEYKDVEGIYIGRIPYVGNIMNSLAEPTTLIIIILGITVVFVIGFSISNKKQKDLEQAEFLEYKRMKEEESKKAAEEKKPAAKKVVSKKTTTKTSTKKSTK